MADNFDSYVPEMVATRRKFHARPELGWTEFETTATVITRLRALGYQALCGTQVVKPEAVLGRDEKLVAAAIERAKSAGVSDDLLSEMGGYTGAVGILDTGRPGPTLAFRFDMDALPIQELQDPAVHLPAKEGFASTFKGVMHACGHDAHTAVGLGVARWLMDHKDELVGKVKLIFQPSEEGTRGSSPMTAAGVVDDVDWFFGGHIGTECHSHEVGVCHDVFLATVKFDVDFTGLESHAGAAPEKGRSALLAAANAAVMLSAISRTSEGNTRISVGKLVAGTGRNITPAHAHMECEVRGTTSEACDFMWEKAQTVVKGAAEMMGVEVKLTKVGEATTLKATPAAMEVVRKAAAAAKDVKEVKEITAPQASEDCTIFTRAVVAHGGNAAFFLYGCEHHGHHRPDFDVQDTVNLEPGLEVFAGIAKEVLGRK